MHMLVVAVVMGMSLYRMVTIVNRAVLDMGRTLLICARNNTQSTKYKGLKFQELE